MRKKAQMICLYRRGSQDAHTLVAGHAWLYPHCGSLLRPGPPMKCPKCQHENRAEAKYCEECAAPLARGWTQCPKCQHENTAQAKFCEECAAPLARGCANCGSQVSSTAKFCPQCGHLLKPVADDPRFASPKSYTPQHLADKILTSRGSPRGRAEAGHRAVRRHQGFDGAVC